MGAANCNDADRLEMPELLEPFRRGIEATVRPCLFLACRAPPGAVAGCRYGGVPLVPWGTAWPQSPRRPMAFLGQLNFAHLTRVAGGALAGLPTRGVLALFYDVEEQRWGFDPRDRDYWRVTYVPDPEQAVALVPPVSVRELFTSHGLVPALASSLPAPGDAHQIRFPAGFTRHLAKGYGALHASFRRQQLGLCGTEHQVMGHPHWLGRDARAQAEWVTRGLYCGGLSSGAAPTPPPGLLPGDWQLLWQLASDDAVGFNWGAGGHLYLMAREADLRAGQFSRSWLVLQC